MRWRGSRWATALAVATVVSCGAPAGPGEDPPAGGDEPVTAQALAWIADQHVTGDAAYAGPSWLARDYGRRAVGANLRFRPAPGEDGELVAVVVAPIHGRRSAELRDALACRSGSRGCVAIDDVTLRWENQAPEEDPGLVYLLHETPTAIALVVYSGPDITGDPREQDLPVDLDELLALARDPRVDLTTSPEAVREGAAYAAWDPQRGA